MKAGVVISIIQEQGGKQAPDLTDDKWDHGSTDGEIYTVIKKGVPPTMMAGWDGRISDTEIWSIVNYLRALAANENVRRPRPRPPRRPTPRQTLELADYVQMPITGEHRRRQHARPAGARELPARRAGRPPLLRQRSQRAALHPRQADASSSRPISISTASPGGPACSRGSPSSATSRPASSTSSSIRTTRATASSTRSTWRIRRSQAPAEPKSGVVARPRPVGLHDDAGDRDADAPGATITREAVLIEWTDRNIANATFEGTARELLRMQLASPIHPLGEMTFNPAARPRRSGLARHVRRRRRLGHRRAARHPPAEPAAARHAGRQDPAHRPRPARAHRARARSARTAAIASRTTTRSSPSRARARRSGRWACAILIG